MLDLNPVTEPVSQNGRTVYREGEIALFCGDSRKMAEVPDDSVHLVICDPPFAVNFSNYGGGTNDSMTPAKYGEWTAQWLDEVRRVLVPGGQLYAMMPLKWIAYWLPAFEHKERKFASSKLDYPWHMLAWTKTGTALHPEKTWLRAWEPVMMMQKGPTLLRYQKTHQYWADKDWVIGFNSMVDAEINRVKKFHPTPRPDWFYEWLISKCSDPGDVVLDGFLGSGTGAFVSKKLGRRFIGYDVHRPYVVRAGERASQTILGLETVPDSRGFAAKQEALALHWTGAR